MLRTNNQKLTTREARLLADNQVADRLIEGTKERLYQKFCTAKDEHGAMAVYQTFCGLREVERELKATINDGLYDEHGNKHH